MLLWIAGIGVGLLATRGDVVIAYGISRERLEKLFLSVVVDHIDQPLAISDERNLSFYLCRDLKAPLIDVWPLLRHYAN